MLNQYVLSGIQGWSSPTQGLSIQNRLEFFFPSVEPQFSIGPFAKKRGFCTSPMSLFSRSINNTHMILSPVLSKRKS